MAKPLPAGFIVPAQPIRASKPPPGPDWVHEIKHDGYRLIVRRDGPTVRLYTRSAYDWTVRLPAIAAAAQRIKAKSFSPEVMLKTATITSLAEEKIGSRKIRGSYLRHHA